MTSTEIRTYRTANRPIQVRKKFRPLGGSNPVRHPIFGQKVRVLSSVPPEDSPRLMLLGSKPYWFLEARVFGEFRQTRLCSAARGLLG